MGEPISPDPDVPSSSGATFAKMAIAEAVVPLDERSDQERLGPWLDKIDPEWWVDKASSSRHRPDIETRSRRERATRS